VATLIAKIKSNSNARIGILLTLIAIALLALAFTAGCGGGGSSAPAAVANNEYPNVSMTAPTGRINPGLNIITLAGSTASSNTVWCRITNFGDGSQNQTEWFECNGSAGVSFQHTYANATANDLTRTVSAEAKNSTNTTTKNFNIVVAPPAAVNPVIPSPTLTGFSCESDTITVGQSISCSANGTCPTGATCYLVVDYGDGSQGTFTGINTQNVSHTYTTTSSNDITYTLSVYATNGVGGPQSAIINHNIRVRQGSLTAPEALRLSESLDFSQVGNDPYHFRIGTICKNSSCTINGTLSTNVNKAYVKTAAGQESEITVNKSNWTWSYTVNVADGEEAIKSFVFWGEDVHENEGPKITVDQKVDRKKPDVPTVFPVTSPTTVSTQTISGTKPKCASVWRGTTQIAAVTDEDNCSLLDSWSELVSFNSYSTYSYSYFSKDTAGNQSNTVTVQIQYTNDGGGGGSCDNDGSCESGENSSSCPNDCGGGGTTCDNDGVCDFDESYSSCPNDCGSGTGDYTLQNTFDVANGSIDLTAYNGNLYTTFADGTVKRYDTGGGETAFTFSGQPEAFGTPLSGSACSSNARYAIADQTRGKVYIYTINDTDNVLTFAFQFGTTGTDADSKLRNPDDVFCDSGSNFWILDRGNNAVKKFSSAGAFICKYAGANQLGQDISADNAGNAYISNVGTDHVDVIDSTCAFLKVVGAGVMTSNPLFDPGELIVDPGAAAIAVADEGNHRIAFYNPSLRTDLGYIGYGTSVAAPKGAAVIAGVFYFLRNSVIESYSH